MKEVKVGVGMLSGGDDRNFFFIVDEDEEEVASINYKIKEIYLARNRRFSVGFNISKELIKRSYLVPIDEFKKIFNLYTKASDLETFTLVLEMLKSYKTLAKDSYLNDDNYL